MVQALQNLGSLRAGPPWAGPLRAGPLWVGPPHWVRPTGSTLKFFSILGYMGHLKNPKILKKFRFFILE